MLSFSKISKCKTCKVLQDKNRANKITIKMEIEKYYTAVNSWQCNLCGEYFPTDESVLIDHIEDEHNE